MCRISLIFFFLLCTAVFILPAKIYAVTTTLSNTPSSISLPDEFTVDITVSGASVGNNYLKIDLYKLGSTNYFGETFNGSEWYNGSEYTKYFQITILSGTDWKGSLKGRVGNPTSTQFD